MDDSKITTQKQYEKDIQAEMRDAHPLDTGGIHPKDYYAKDTDVTTSPDYVWMLKTVGKLLKADGNISGAADCFRGADRLEKLEKALQEVRNAICRCLNNNPNWNLNYQYWLNFCNNALGGTLMNNTQTIQVYLDDGRVFEYDIEGQVDKAREHAYAICSGGYRHSDGETFFEYYPAHRILKVKVEGATGGTAYPDKVRGT